MRQISERLDIHYTPKHGSWLNMAGIEIGVVAWQYLEPRIPDLGDGFTGHSGRVGMAQDLVKNGVELLALMTAGRWKSAKMPPPLTSVHPTDLYPRYGDSGLAVPLYPVVTAILTRANLANEVGPSRPGLRLAPPRRVKNQATASFIPAHLNPGVGASAGCSHLEATPAAGRDGPGGHKRPSGRHSQTAPRVAAPGVGPHPCCGPKQPARNGGR